MNYAVNSSHICSHLQFFSNWHIGLWQQRLLVPETECRTSIHLEMVMRGNECIFLLRSRPNELNDAFSFDIFQCAVVMYALPLYSWMPPPLNIPLHICCFCFFFFFSVSLRALTQSRCNQTDSYALIFFLHATSISPRKRRMHAFYRSVSFYSAMYCLLCSAQVVTQKTHL